MSVIAGVRRVAMSVCVLVGASAAAQATVGRTAGEGAVTAVGAARYSIPLALPPGTNGLAPTLAVDYDSRGGNGLLGVGFRLAGLSAIRRCPSTLAQDGRIAPVALDGSDRFCLDGLRLRLTAGTYGAAGSQYQTEIETFARVTAVGVAGDGPASFRVERRDGLIYEYGTTVDSRVEAAASVTAREWALSRIRDRVGNYADFSYTEDVANGSHRPAAVSYAGNLQTGTQPAYRVSFTYGARPAHELPHRFIAAGAVTDPVRLDRIAVVHLPTGRVVRSYDFTYDTAGSTVRSRLASVRECAGISCLPATLFTWTRSTAGWGVSFSVPISTAQLATAIPGDMDGDGFDDLAYQDTATRHWRILRGSTFGFLTPAVNTDLGADSDATQAISVDVDGDGRRDILVPGSGNYWHRLRWTPAAGYQYNATGVINPAPPGGLIAADIDGDGRDDLVYVRSGGAAIYWRRNRTTSSSSYAAEAVLWTVPAGTQLASTPFLETAQRFRSIVRSGDFNGDGRADLLVRVAQDPCSGAGNCNSPWVHRWLLLASSGSALVPAHVFTSAADAMLADFNADGLTDVGYPGSSGRWELLLGSGARGPVPAGLAGPYATSATVSSTGAAMVVDWDADGRSDILQPGPGGELQYCRSASVTLESCLPTGIAVGTTPGSSLTLDLSGDGYPDFVYGTATVLQHLHYHVPPDLLLSAQDGLGRRIAFEYAPLSSAAVHRVGTAAAFPVRDVAKPAQLASKLTDTAGGRTLSYFYEGARVHVQGRGFLGFARRTVTSSAAEPVRVEEYLQDPAAPERIGMPSLITLQQSSGLPLTRTAYSWARLTSGAGYEARVFGYPNNITLEQFELDGVRVSSTVTRNTVDAFGNVVQQLVTTTEHAKGSNPGAQHIDKVALSGVVNDTTNWCLGRPAQTRLTRRHGLPGGTAVTRTRAHAWDYVRCRPTQETVEPSSSTLRVTTDLAYDAHGNLASTQVMPVGQPARNTSVDWGADGRFPRVVTNPEGHVVTTDWDGALAVPVVSTDPNGLATQSSYDDFGRPVGQVRPDGTRLVVTRGACGVPCPWYGTAYVVTESERSAQDTPIVTREAGYDQRDRRIYERQQQPGGAEALRALQYDARGLLSQESLPVPCCTPPSRWLRHSYDLLGRRTATERPTSSTDPTPLVTRWQHDGLAVTAIDPLGRRTTRRFDALGRVLQVVDPAGVDADYEYDAFGQLLRVRDVAGTETLVAYDLLGNRRSIDDPGFGPRTFEYLPTGELRSQRNARGQTTSFTYDRLSRPLTRDEPEGRTTWTWGNSVAARNVGSLAAVASPGFAESYHYDNLGRPSIVTTSIAGHALETRRSYDASSGLPDVLTYPATGSTTPLRLRHHHERGRLVRLSDADSGATYWQLNAVDPFGFVTDETLGNGVRIASSRDAVTGRLMARTAGPGGGSALQDYAYAWDAVGNLAQRDERNRGLQERFYYDDRDRLDYVTRWGSVVLDLDYDATGNLSYKSDVGSYRYDPTRKQAVVAAGANTYSYDANGAVTNANGTSVQWLSHDLPALVIHPGGNQSLFEYGADRGRSRQVAQAGGVVTETLYAAGGLYERVTSGGVTSQRYYVVADGRRVAVQARRPGATPVTTYLLEDHLGGVDAITSSSGQLLARTSYQAFGARRAGDGAGGAPTSSEWQQIQATTPRGYTDHEHLDNLGLVHMNGRIYDPDLGRFLSPDPVVQAPYDTQGLNRYAYVHNNPLAYTDPSGYCRFHTYVEDAPAPYCFTSLVDTIVVTARRLTDDFSWIGDLFGPYVPSQPVPEMVGGGGVGLPAVLENVDVTGPRLGSYDSQVPIDILLMGVYNLLQQSLIGELLESSTLLGENAVYHYIAREDETANPLYRLPGLAAALWTPNTASQTSLLFGAASGLGRWSSRPFWQYSPASTRAYRSTWLTRSAGWTPPYQTGDHAAAMLSLPAYNPGTAVRPWYPHWYQYVRGPRVVEPQPSFGAHAVGGGLEYRVIPFSE